MSGRQLLTDECYRWTLRFPIPIDPHRPPIASGRAAAHNRGCFDPSSSAVRNLPMFTNLSRRRFLALSTAAAGATWLGSSPNLHGAALADANDLWGGFPVGVQSYSLREFKLPDAIRQLEGMGVRYVEL